MNRRIRRALSRLVVGVPLILLASASTQGCQGDGFECGRPIGGSDVVRRCDRSLEICVCATNSCARRVGPRTGAAGAAGAAAAGAGAGGAGGSSTGGAGSAAAGAGCTSGYRYVEAPFARRGLAGQCVSDADLDYATIESTAAIGTLCPGAVVPEAGTAGTAGASTAGSSGASGAGAGGGGSAGEAGRPNVGGEAGEDAP